MTRTIAGRPIKQWLRKWRRQQALVKRNLRDSYIHHLLGERLFHPHIWTLDRYALAGGLALGLFVAFTPTIPFQMLLATLGALFLSVNLPVAVLACWVTNPLTALPIYLAARRLGEFLLRDTALVDNVAALFGFQGYMGMFMEQSLYLWAGSLVFASVAGLLGYLVAQLAWDLAARWLRQRKQHRS